MEDIQANSSEPNQGSRLWVLLYPFGSLVLGLFVVPIAIEQYPEIFKESSWILPLSIAVMVGCWVPLLFDRRGKTIWKWSTRKIGLFCTIAVAVVLLVGCALGARYLYGHHVRHLEARLKSKAVSPQIARQYQLTFVFKDSPLLTDRAKTFIKDRIENYFEYLEGAGLDVPREVVPIGTATPDGLGGCGAVAVALPAPIYREGAIHIAETCLDNGPEITGLYSDWIFDGLLDSGPPGGRPDGYNRFHAQSIFSLYYLSSFYNQLSPDAQQGIHSWPVVLWEMREQFGRDFTDRSMAQAVKSMNENLKYRPNVSFDEYLCYHLGIGVSVIDNEGHKKAGVQRLLALNGLCSIPPKR